MIRLDKFEVVTELFPSDLIIGVLIVSIFKEEFYIIIADFGMAGYTKEENNADNV